MANRHPSQRGTRRVLFAIQSARRPMFSGAARTASGPVGPWHGSVPVSPFRALPIGTARLEIGPIPAQAVVTRLSSTRCCRRLTL